MLWRCYRISDDPHASHRIASIVFGLDLAGFGSTTNTIIRPGYTLVEVTTPGILDDDASYWLDLATDIPPLWTITAPDPN
jgi:hypothetical protein